MIIKEEELECSAIQSAVALIAGAIKTAPKSRGINALKTIVLTDKDKDKVAGHMETIDKPPFKRDAQNIREADAVVIIGMKTIRVGLDCGMCSYTNCGENEKNNGLCIFNQVDLGIALGSAVSSAMNLKVDNRIMYTVGYAARDLKIMEAEYSIQMGIHLKFHHKNIQDLCGTHHNLQFQLGLRQLLNPEQGFLFFPVFLV